GSGSNAAPADKEESGLWSSWGGREVLVGEHPRVQAIDVAIERDRELGERIRCGILTEVQRTVFHPLQARFFSNGSAVDDVHRAETAGVQQVLKRVRVDGPDVREIAKIAFE